MRILFLSICLLIATGSSVQGGETVKIGLTLGLTGKYEEMSEMNRMGLMLWVEQVNRRPEGLLGKKIDLIIYDDKSDPKTGAMLYEKLINQDKVDLLFGPYSSGITEAVLPVTEKYGFPLLLIGAAADSLWAHGYKYSFGIFTPASRYTVGFLEMAAMAGITKIAIVYADDSFSTTIAEGAKEWGEKFGLQAVFYQSFKKGNRDLAEIAAQAKASGATALVVCGHLNESLDMRKALKVIAWTPQAFYASVGPATQAYQDLLGADANLSFSSSQWEPSVKYKAQDHELFLDAFSKKYKRQPSYHAAQAYAAGQIMQAAIDKAQGLNRERLRDILSVMDSISIIGRYKVDQTGKQVRHFQITLQIQKGKKEIVWPESLATAQPIFQ